MSRAQEAVYVSGPMRGRPGANEDAFRAERERLRGLGHEVVCPHEKPSQVEAARTGVFDTVALLLDDVRLIAERCGRIQLLPGWAESRGSRAEVAFAFAVGIPVHIPLYRDGTANEAVTRHVEGLGGRIADEQGNEYLPPIVDPAQADGRASTSAEAAREAAREVHEGLVEGKAAMLVAAVAETQAARDEAARMAKDGYFRQETLGPYGYAKAIRIAVRLEAALAAEIAARQAYAQAQATFSERHGLDHYVAIGER